MNEPRGRVAVTVVLPTVVIGAGTSKDNRPSEQMQFVALTRIVVRAHGRRVAFNGRVLDHDNVVGGVAE